MHTYSLDERKKIEKLRALVIIRDTIIASEILSRFSHDNFVENLMAIYKSLFVQICLFFPNQEMEDMILYVVMKVKILII